LDYSWNMSLDPFFNLVCWFKISRPTRTLWNTTHCIICGTLTSNSKPSIAQKKAQLKEFLLWSLHLIFCSYNFFKINSNESSFFNWEFSIVLDLSNLSSSIISPLTIYIHSWKHHMKKLAPFYTIYVLLNQGGKIAKKQCLPFFHIFLCFNHYYYIKKIKRCKKRETFTNIYEYEMQV